MSFLLLILFIVFGLWLLKNAARIWLTWKMNSARRHFEEMFNASRQPEEGPRQPAHKPRKRKKIDPDVGEYVAFEEIRTEIRSSSTPPPPSTPENQVEDAEWEDLPK